MSQIADRIAQTLIANGYARELPADAVPCTRTRKLSAQPSWGYLYVKPSGEIRSGYTLRTSKPLPDLTRRMALGEEA